MSSEELELELLLMGPVESLREWDSLSEEYSESELEVSIWLKTLPNSNTSMLELSCV